MHGLRDRMAASQAIMGRLRAYMQARSVAATEADAMHGEVAATFTQFDDFLLRIETIARQSNLVALNA